eukprot:TRINITY_DN5311_c0_g1_i1.p1 TRINITY_DN5311_c0_g1~~TRINITY_DN5311_c0_g1_i1.p1  ORF type:complete len:243 (+),score=29.07 TRINITY_DN5311_c0_g1_i1:305-1033(+)
MNVMDAAKNVKCRVVYASTSGTVACSKNSKVVGHDASPHCTNVVEQWPYYHSKIESEKQALKFAEENNVELVILRPSMILGPGDVTLRSTRVIYSFLTKKLITPSGGVSFVDVRDVALAFKNAMIKGVPGKAYLLASCNCSIREWFRTLEELTGVSSPLYLGMLPTSIWLGIFNALNFLKRKFGKYDPVFDPVRAEMAIHYWNAYGTAAYSDLDFRPRDPKETLIDTLYWVQENKALYHHKL